MINGILNVYKERGYTSHDVVAKLRGILKQKKIGHTGTLDPEAQGVLPVCLGNATKVCDLLTDKDKTYRAVLLLGTVTDTQDTTGNVLSQSPVLCTEQEVRDAAASFVGEQEQVPPMYSALKVNGKKLYELARQGIEVERKPRLITIHEIEIEQIQLPEIVMKVTCSKGTYIRTLCHDIGQKLGCGGCMKELLRTKVGPFVLENSVRLEEIASYQKEERISDILIQTDAVFGALPALYLTRMGERVVQNGNPLPDRLDAFGRIEREQARNNSKENAVSGMEEDGQKKCSGMPKDKTRFRVYGEKGAFLAVYEWNEQRKSYRPVKMFLQK